MARKLLVGSAVYLGAIWTGHGLTTIWVAALRAWGGNAKKRATVAVARKLAVLLHRLWVSAEVYEPLHNAMSAPIAAAA
jgi:transposase